jgi:hypothetical protein
MVFISGCEKTYVVSQSQDILFQYEHISRSPGHNLHGFIIDNKGDVLLFNNPANWNLSDKDHLLSKEQVNENISNCTKTSLKISKSDLQKYINYIDNIASSKVSAVKNRGSSKGNASFLCFQYSENTSIYKETIVKIEGDITCENLNFYSKKVIEWMKDISHSIDSEK